VTERIRTDTNASAVLLMTSLLRSMWHVITRADRRPLRVASVGSERREAFRSILLAAAFAVAAASLSSCLSGPQWPCDRDDRANTFPGDEPGARAYETREAAIEAWLPTVAEVQGVEPSRLEAALAARSGPDRYEPERVRIYLDDQIFAEISIGTPDTGEWWVVSVWACRPGSVDW